MERFSRMAMLVGENGIEKLSKMHVVLLGVGGVGSYTAEALARSGVGKITIIDHDKVSLTNINRQLCALSSTVDEYKVDVVAKRILDINDKCCVNPIKDFFTSENADVLLKGKIDYIIDAIDTVSSKIFLAQYAQENNIPLISCMGTGNKFNPTLFEVSDIYKTSVCPLCRIMRKELKERKVKSLKVVYSKEQPAKPLPTKEVTAKRQIPGSLSFVPPVAGMILASEVINSFVKYDEKFNELIEN